MNNIIERIEGKMSEVNSMLSSYRDRLKNNKDDFSTEMAIKSLEYHLEELQTQLYQEKLFREKEIVEIRLKGFKADQGTIPLSVLSDIATYLSKSLHSLAYRIKKGVDPYGRIPAEIVETMNLRLAGLAYGSTRLYFSGNLNPNLFGHSLIEDSLEKTFKVFSSHSPRELTDSVSDIGTKSAKNINGLLKALEKNGLEADLTWIDPKEKTHTWHGSSDSIHEMLNAFDNIISTKTETINVDGELIMLSKKGRFEIQTPGKVTYRGQFPIDIIENVRMVRIGSRAEAEIIKETVFNKITEYEKTVYVLNALKAV